MPYPDTEQIGEGYSYRDVWRAGNLSVRDWFAGQALVGMYLADELSRFLVGKEDRTRPLRTTDTEFATSAYQQADAMLRARAVDGGGR